MIRRLDITQNQTGAAALVALLSISAIVLLFGLTIAIKASIEVGGTRRIVDASTAYYAAQSGIEDALTKLNRDKTFVNIACTHPTAPCYSLTLGETTVDIDIATSPSTKITSTATLGEVIRKVEVTVVVDSKGVITLSNWKEV